MKELEVWYRLLHFRLLPGFGCCLFAWGVCLTAEGDRHAGDGIVTGSHATWNKRNARAETKSYMLSCLVLLDGSWHTGLAGSGEHCVGSIGLCTDVETAAPFLVYL